MFGIDPQYYPALGIGTFVLVALSAFLVYRTVKSSTPDPQPQISAQPSEATDIPTIEFEVGAIMRDTFEIEERRSLIDLVSVMAGFGPTMSDDKYRIGAQHEMGPQVYTVFIRTVMTAAELPKSAVISERTLFDLSNYPEADLLDSDVLLTFLVAYAKPIAGFYKKFSLDKNLADTLLPFNTMIGVIDKLVEVHGKYYA